MPKAYSYIRFSTPEQSRGDSFRRQAELSRMFAMDHGLDLEETLTFHDLGVSAFTGQNAEEGALAAFVEAVDSGRIATGSYLLVESLDRLSRAKVSKAFRQLSDILDRGINVATLQDGKVYSPTAYADNFADLMLSLSIMFRANEESETKSKRLRSAWESKRHAATEAGRKLTAVCPAWLSLNEDRNSFTVLEQRSKIVRLIFELTLDGVGAQRIASRFNEEGVETFGRSNGWHSSYVKKILSNPAVIGVYQPMKTVRDGSRKLREIGGAEIRGYFPAVIEEGVFFRAGAARASRNIGSGKKGTRFSNLFTGIAVCGHCDGSMYFINKGSGGHYLHCSNARRRIGNCVAPSWQYRPIEAFILLTLTEVDYSEVFPTVWASTSRQIKELEGQLLTKEDELGTAKRQLNGVLELLIERPKNPTVLAKFDALEATVGDLESETVALQAQVDGERSRLRTLRYDHDRARGALEELASLHRDGDTSEVYRVRSRFHQLLKRTITTIVFTTLPDDPEQHGVIDFRFKDAPAIERRLEIMRGQQEGIGYRVDGGQAVQGSARYVRIGRLNLGE